MKREFLEGLGLEKEIVEKIIGEHGKSVESNKSKLKDITTDRDDLKNQLEQRDKDLKDLKKKAEGSEELQTQLADLQSKYDTDKGEYEQKLKDTQLSSAIKLALAGKVHDTDIAITQIDKATIELDTEGKITKGLDEQLKILQESKPFLFVLEKKKQTFKGWDPADSNNDKDSSSDIGSNFAKEANSKGTTATGSLNPWANK